MYYLSERTVSNAYSSILSTKTQNKFWGLLSIIHEIDSYPIKTNHTYVLSTKKISLWLDEVLYFGNDKKEYGERDCFVRFPTEWIENIADPSNGILKSNRINILDVACFIYKLTPFEKEYSASELIAKLRKEFNLSEEIVSSWFVYSHYELSYTENIISKSSMLTALKDVKSDLTDCISFEVPIKSRPGEMTRAPFIQTLYAGTNALKCLMFATFNLEELYPTSRIATIETKDMRLQQIFYGAPGTGKSNTIKCEVDQKGLPKVRTTFHPDSDYSTFVGAYKPTSVEVPTMTMIGTKAVPAENPDGTPRMEKKIVYEFVPQAFLKAYTGAWKNQDDPFFLIIEEINRGNCAQIFGDLFQLLDRNDETGLSDYPISPDEDIQKFLQSDKKYGFAELKEEQKAAIPKEVLSGELMILPKNLHIWATMNTSDQSLFPIDSAFKRRWDWRYMPISDGKKGWLIEANGKRFDWWQFLQKMNDKIGSTTNSEDKKLGYYFCKAKNGIIDAETFVGKVFFYIWNDVFKDFAEEAGDLFKDSDGTLLSFNKFYMVGNDGKTKVAAEKVTLFLQNLGVDEVENGEGDEVIGDTDSGARRILHVEFEDETIAIRRFPEYLQVLRKIGLDKAEAVASEKQVNVLGCALVTKEPEETIETSQYTYVEADGYYVVKGIKGKVMQNFLPLISGKYNLNLKIEYR